MGVEALWISRHVSSILPSTASCESSLEKTSTLLRGNGTLVLKRRDHIPYFGIQKGVLNELRPVFPPKQNKNNAALGKMPSQQVSNVPTMHSLLLLNIACICSHASVLVYNITFIFVVI